MKQTIRLGTRGSQLALWQTKWVKSKLGEKFPDHEFETVTIKTTGDKILDSPLAEIGDKGLFTKELDKALLDGSIDLAVHSMKDVPTEYHEDLVIAAVTERWDVRDVLISRTAGSLDALPEGATVATGSVRRKTQLLHLRPDLNIIDIRGNLNTRFRKFDESDWDGMILAAAGVERLGWSERIAHKIAVDTILPAVGQGCFAVITHREKKDIIQMLQIIHNQDVAAAVFAERALLRAVEGGCQVPLGAYGEVKSDKIYLQACIVSMDGKKYYKSDVSLPVFKPEDAGKNLALKLISRGAGEVLDEIKNVRTKA